MATNSNFLYYNDVTVVVDGYVVSNVNKKGIPGDACGCHLESITIKSACYQANSNASLGASGSVSLIDYRYAVFNKLVDYYNRTKDVAGSSPYPVIEVEIECFTGRYVYSGTITKWDMRFDGGAPKIELTWGVYSPTDPTARPITPSRFKNPDAVLKHVQDHFSKQNMNIDFVYIVKGKKYKNEAIKGKLDFIGGEMYLDPSRFPVDSNGNRLVAFYMFMCMNLCTADGKNSVQGSIQTENKKPVFVVRPSDPLQNTEDDEVAKGIDDLIFVQNGQFKPYVASDKLQNRTVVPLTSINFTTNLNNIALAPAIQASVNGSTVESNTGNYNTISPTGSAALENSNSKAKDRSLIEVSFECYNVMCFAVNNDAYKPILKIYNEFGEEIKFLSGAVTVQEVEYTLSGAVVKANVKCTKVYSDNNMNIEVTSAIKQTDSDEEDEDDGFYFPVDYTP